MADKIFLPQQTTRRGVAGYRDPDNRIVVVDRSRNELPASRARKTASETNGSKGKGKGGKQTAAATTEATTDGSATGDNT